MLFSVVRQLTVLTPQILGSGNVCVCLYVDLSARLFKKGAAQYVQSILLHCIGK